MLTVLRLYSTRVWIAEATEYWAMTAQSTDGEGGVTGGGGEGAAYHLPGPEQRRAGCLAGSQQFSTLVWIAESTEHRAVTAQSSE